MNLATVDLNLLVALEALLEERSVTKAGQRIGLAQPSMSNVLARLRELFEDDLFVRTPGGMVPTPRTLEMAPHVAEALSHIRQVLNRGDNFNPATTDRSFTVAVSDYSDIILMPRVVKELRRRAPRVGLNVKALNPLTLYDEMDCGQVDLAVAGHLSLPARFNGVCLIEEKFVCIIDPQHSSIEGGMDLAAYASMPHVMFSRDGGTVGAVDDALAAVGLKRRVAITIPHVAAVPFAVRGTDLVATVAERIARLLLSPAGVAICDLPCAIPPFAIELISSRRMENDPAINWLRNLIKEVANHV